MFLEILQNSQEKTYARVNFIKKKTLVQVFSCEFCEIFTKNFFTEHLWATTSGLVKPCLNSDLHFISKTSGTAIVETIVSYKPLPCLLQENRKTYPSALRDTSTT